MNLTKQINNRFNIYKTFLIIFSVLICSTLLLFFTANAVADDYYVKTLGNNGTNGTSWQSAWQTIGYAVSNVTSGDVIIVSNGTYTEKVLISHSTNISLVSWPWISSGDNTKAIVKCIGLGANLFEIDNSKNILINGFLLNGASASGDASHSILIWNNSISNKIANNIAFSNWDAGINIFNNTCSFNYIISNRVFKQLGAGQRDGIRIDGFNNIIENNEIYKNIGGIAASCCGIYLNTTASNNIIKHNFIYSNKIGIKIDGNNNLIASNNITLCSNDGIQISQGNNNTILSNQIYNNNNGINLIGNVTYNYIIKNSVYSNAITGILIDSDNTDNNFIMYNNIYGSNQNYGIVINNGDHNTIYSNKIHHNNWGGIRNLSGSASSNYFIKNSIYSNEFYGIFINSSTAFNNYILTNIIWGGNQDYGIYISSSTNHKIYRNLIKKNERGIYLAGSANNIEIINNTIYGILYGDGIHCRDTSSCIILNNIILSNGIGVGGYGIQNAGSGIIYAAYNDIYGNADGPTNGGLIWGNGNVTNNPMIDTLSTFQIISSNSPAIDSATNISGISDNYNGNGPDMGWKESSYGATASPDDDDLEPPVLPEDVAVYNNYLDLSTGESAHIIFGKAGNAEIKIYNIKGVLVMSWEKQYYDIGEGQFWNGTVKESIKKAGAGLYIVVVKGDINKKLKMIIKK